MKKIKVTKDEFVKAEENGCVFGQDLSRQSGKVPWSVYIELGEEKEYCYRDNESTLTEYRYFVRCKTYYAEDDAKIDEEDYAFYNDLENIAIFV